MINNILKTLSDTEIMAVADQLTDPKVDELFVYRQLVSKANDPVELEDMFNEVNSDGIRGTLPRLVLSEITQRYREILSA